MKHGIFKSLTLIAVILFLAACAKNHETKQLETTTDNETASPDNQATNETEQTQQDVVFSIEDFKTFKQHMEAGTLPEFFKTDGWKHIFPDLETKPDALAGLQSGENTFVARQGAGGSTFYLGVKTSMAASDDIDPADMFSHLELPAGIIQ